MKYTVGRARQWAERLGWVGVVLIWAFGAERAAGADRTPGPPRWKTGAEFRQALDARIDDVVWSAGTPLRQALETVARTQHIAIMIDRRIDPDSPVGLSARDTPVRELIAQLAAQCGGTPTCLDGVVYVGPRMLTLHLATTAQQRRSEAQRLTGRAAERLAAKRAWRWDELAEPRALVADLAREADLRVVGIEQLPHDLWPALDLPPLAWTDRMTLVLAGFGLTFALADGGTSARLVPLPAPDLVSRSYQAVLSSSQLDAVKSLFRDATIDERAGRIEFSGTVDEHDRLRRLLERQTATRPSGRPADHTGLTLKVASQPVDAILSTLERQLGVKFQIQAGLETSLHTRVSLDVREASLSELLDAALAPAGLSHHSQGDVIVIQPGAREPGK